MEQKSENTQFQGPYYPSPYQQPPVYQSAGAPMQYPGVGYADPNQYIYPQAPGQVQGYPMYQGNLPATVVIARPNPLPMQPGYNGDDETILTRARIVKIASIVIIVVRYATFLSLLCILFPVLGFLAARDIKFNLLVGCIIGEFFTGAFLLGLVILFVAVGNGVMLVFSVINLVAAAIYMTILWSLYFAMKGVDAMNRERIGNFSRVS